MEEEISLIDFATPVHRVLLEPNQLFGIGIAPAMFILVITIVLMNMDISYRNCSFYCLQNLM